jgi:hypothetical protein
MKNIKDLIAYIKILLDLYGAELMKCVVAASLIALIVVAIMIGG